MRKIILLICSLFIVVQIAFGQWDVFPSAITWSPTNSTSPNVLPGATFNHNALITANVNFFFEGGTAF
jgi:hypothetical protein